MTCPTILDYPRWEFIKGNKKVRKQENKNSTKKKRSRKYENKNSTKKAIKKQENKNLTKKKESKQDLDQEEKKVLPTYFFVLP